MIAQLNKAYILSKPSKILPRLLSYFFYEGRPATTRGRWFNPITFVSLKAVSKTKHLPGAESPVFITGTGRSGSTILGLVLSMHPDAGFLNEPKALWYHANHDDDLIGSYSNGPAKYKMNKADATPEISSVVKSIYSAYLKSSGSNRIVDKFPEMIFRIEYLNQIFNDPKYIFLYRNAWETIASTATWSNTNRDRSKQEDWWGVKNRKWNFLLEQVVPFDDHLAPLKEIISEFTNQTDMAAVEWIATMNQGIKMSIAFPDRVMPVKYEDLSQNREQMLHQICEFTGLRTDEHFINFGCKTLNPSLNGVKVKVHPALMEPIFELSKKLGYKVYSPSMSVTE